MALTVDDLQPKKFKVKVGEQEYWCKPPRMAHRLILMRVQPLFEAIANYSQGSEFNISSEKILEYQKDLDTLFNDLIPEMKNITIDEELLVDLIDQILTHTLPDESQKLKEAKVKPNDPKAEKTG